MSHYMTALAMKQKGLSPAAKIVLYWIADHHNGETGKCFPSINRLSYICEMCETSVKSHLRQLEKVGLIKRFSRVRPDGGKTSNQYSLCFSDVELFNDGQNTTMGGSKSDYGHGQNTPINLVTNNLGIKPSILAQSNEYLDTKFNDFYTSYPRKTARGAAKVSWRKACKGVDADVIISQAVLFAASVEGKDKKFIPHPATWLNQERWDDEVFAQADSEQDQNNLVQKIFAEMVKPNA